MVGHFDLGDSFEKVAASLNTGIFDLLHTGVALLSDRGNFLYCNRAFLEMFGVAKDIIGKNVTDVFVTGERGVMDVIRTQEPVISSSLTVNNEQGVSFRYPVKDKDGKLCGVVIESVPLSLGKEKLKMLMETVRNLEEAAQHFEQTKSKQVGRLFTFADIVGEKRVLGCTVAWGATMQGPGVCELTSEADSLSFSLGSLSKDRNPHFDEVKSLLEMMGKVEIDENFIGTRWSKLLINAAFSGMSAVLGCTFGEAAGPKESRRIVQALIKECIDVCAAGGIRIEPVQGKDIVKLLDYKGAVKKAISFFIIPLAIRKHARLKASMLQDLEKGKLTEVDAINGAVSDYGRKVGVPTPMNDKVVEIIHGIERGELKPGFDNLKLF